MKRATLKQRFLALLIDYIVFTIVAFLVIKLTNGTMKGFGNLITIVIFINLLFFMKDAKGQSFGKKLLNIKIVKKKDDSKPGYFLPFFRNMLLCLGVIEIIAILINKDNERLGDIITGTMVVEAA
jgi:uncharacterized RDD family membrane protein YckC